MEKLSDISLVTKVVMLHDRKSFDLLVKKYQSPIRGFFLRQTLGDAQLSDDLAQDTFVKAYTHLTSFRGTASFSTWLYRIAYNVWYDYTRSHKETQDNERTCITLQLMDGLSIDKIAEVTGMVQGTIKSHLSRGKQKLASYLKQNGYDR